MTIEELKSGLSVIVERQSSPEGSDKEDDHGWADELLLEFIANDEVTELYESIKKWYA